MSKIICDVCGTSYQDSATHCPICGCVRPEEVTTGVENNDAETQRSGNYTYVKGGRFSKANVQKRNKGIAFTSIDAMSDEPGETKGKANKGDTGLVIAVCALLLAIIGVVIYIAIHFFAPLNQNVNTPATNQSTTVAQTTVAETEAPTQADILCSDMILSTTEVTLDSVGATHQLEVLLTPADTTEALVFLATDESVATVSDSGVITAVGAGETIINVSCGEATAQCRVVCNIVQEPDTTEPTVQDTPTVTYKAPYRINKKAADVSIHVNETFELKLLDANGEVIPVTWSAAVGDICVIDGNAITGVLKGKTEISTTYDGQTFTCIVRVK